MPKIAYPITSFKQGEVSPLTAGRFDSPAYPSACRLIQNMFPLPQGGLTRTPGSRHGAAGKLAGRRVRLIPYMVSPTDGIACEFGHQYIRFYRNYAPILDGATVVEIASTYTESDLEHLRFVQIWNTLYLVHALGTFPVRKLVRTTDVNWSLTTVTFTAGVGEEDFSTADHYPRFCAVFQQRLVLGPTNTDRKIWGSQTGNPENFTLGTSATDAWVFAFQPDRKAEIQFLLAGDALIVGTSHGVYRVADKTIVLTPSTAWSYTIQSSLGGNSVQPLLVDDSVVFVQKAGQKIRQFRWSDENQQFYANDLTYQASHIAAGGVREMAYQDEPESVLWVVREDGVLVSMVYYREEGFISWSRHDFSGQVESIAVVPTAGEDAVWISVKRTVGGTAVRHIEQLTPWWREDIKDAFFVDGGVTMDWGDPVSVTSISNANPAVVTAVAHGFSDGFLVRFRSAGFEALNADVYMVKNPTADTFELYHLNGTTTVDMSGESAPATGGEVERVNNVVSGLGHLEGEEVIALGDGSVIAAATVVSGAVTLDEYPNRVHVGLAKEWAVEPLDVGAGVERIKRVVEIYAKFYRSFGAEVGPDEDHMQEVLFEEGDITMDEPPDLLTGSLLSSFPGDFEYEGRIRIAGSLPMPATLLCLIAQVEYA